MSKRLCPNCKYALNEWQTAMCPECGVALDVAVGGPVCDCQEVDEPADEADSEDVIVDPPLKKVSVERKIKSLASAIWTELRCRSYSLDSERWTRVVEELLLEVVEEFKERITKADSLYQSRFNECEALTERLRRYHKKYGCVRCGKPIQVKSNTDQCNTCSHQPQADTIRERMMAKLCSCEEGFCDE